MMTIRDDNISFLLSELVSENLRPTRIGDVNAEWIDARLALIRWRIEHDREVALPSIRRLDRSVEIARCFHPFDFVGAVACGQHDFTSTETVSVSARLNGGSPR